MQKLQPLAFVPVGAPPGHIFHAMRIHQTRPYPIKSVLWAESYSMDMASMRMILGLVLMALTSGAQHFPPLDQDNPPQSRTLQSLMFCMTARKNIPLNSSQPLFTFNFAPPGASGSVLIDGKTIKTFKDERHLRIYADVTLGDHEFILRLDGPATNTFMSSNSDFKYCQP